MERRAAQGDWRPSREAEQNARAHEARSDWGGRQAEQERGEERTSREPQTEMGVAAFRRGAAWGLIRRGVTALN